MSEFSELVDAVSVRLSTKAELVSHYRAEYPGKGKKDVPSWRGHITKDIARISGLKESSVSRRFDSGEKGGENRLARPGTAQEQLQYQELGEEIGPLPPAGGYLVKFRGTLKISKVCTDKERDFEELITGDDAKLLAQTGDFGIVLKHYGGGFEGICDIYHLEVIPGKDEVAKPHKHEGHGATKYLQYLKK